MKKYPKTPRIKTIQINKDVTAPLSPIVSGLVGSLKQTVQAIAVELLKTKVKTAIKKYLARLNTII